MNSWLFRFFGLEFRRWAFLPCLRVSCFVRSPRESVCRKPTPRLRISRACFSPSFVPPPKLIGGGVLIPIVARSNLRFRYYASVYRKPHIEQFLANRDVRKQMLGFFRANRAFSFSQRHQRNQLVSQMLIDRFGRIIEF